MYSEIIANFAVTTLEKRYPNIDFAVKISKNIDVIEKNIWEFKPDIFISHCHTAERDFERIRRLTRELKKRLDNCFIIITHHPDINEIYSDIYLQGYENDNISPYFLDDDTLTKLDKMIRTTHNKP